VNWLIVFFQELEDKEMTTRSKIIMINAVILAILVIIGLASSLKAMPLGNTPIYLLVIFGSASVLSIPIVYFSKVRPKRYEKLLGKDYAHRYELLKDILGQSGLPARSRREVLNDCLELLINAQHADKPVDDVIPDVSSFAKEILETYSRRKSHWWHLLPNSILYFVVFVLGMQAVVWLEDNRQDWFSIRTDLSMLVLIGLISFGLIPVMNLRQVQSKTWFYFLPLATGLSFVLIAELARRFTPKSWFVKVILDESVQLIPSYWVFIVFIGLIPLMILLRLIVKRFVYINLQRK
jgi:DNA-binding ferritin-like protein (Dps family)